MCDSVVQKVLQRLNWTAFSFAQLLPRASWYPCHCFLKSKNIISQATYFSTRDLSCVYESPWLLQSVWVVSFPLCKHVACLPAILMEKAVLLHELSTGVFRNVVSSGATSNKGKNQNRAALKMLIYSGK